MASVDEEFAGSDKKHETARKELKRLDDVLVYGLKKNEDELGD